jgi:hypothetical protein
VRLVRLSLPFFSLSGRRRDPSPCCPDADLFFHSSQLLDRRITNGRDELLRMKEKMERRRDHAKQRKKALEDAHASHFETKKVLEMKAAEKGRQAGEVEAQVRRLSLSSLPSICEGRNADAWMVR